MEYETGRWYGWDGGSKCPFDKSNTNYYIITLDGSIDGFFDSRLLSGDYCGAKVYHKSAYKGFWDWNKDGSGTAHGHVSVVGFYIISYNKPKEMTVAEIQDALGYNIKIVK